jgi:hypothetical protein
MLAQHEELGHRVIDRAIQRGPPVQQREPGNAAVGPDQEWHASRLSPVRVERRRVSE